MRLVIHLGPKSFLRDVQDELERLEERHSLILGVVFAAERDTAIANEQLYLATVHAEDGSLLLAAAMTPPHPVMLTPTNSADAIARVATDLAESGRELTGVFAPASTASAFAEQWRDRTGDETDLAFGMWLYSAKSVAVASDPPGQFRLVVPNNEPVVAEWIAAFQREIFAEDIRDRARQIAERRIAAQELYVWDDSGMRSMAGTTRRTRHGISVNAVYTPPEWRGRGYASACVRHLTARLLGEGCDFCALFADKANATTNAIYQRIGYRQIDEFAHHRFQRAPKANPTPSRSSL